MIRATSTDRLLVQWGDRLFYPGNRVVTAQALPRLVGSTAARAQDIRRRIHATVVRRAPQVMVKVTGGGRGMGAIAAHFRYVSKSGRLTFHDDRGLEHEGKDAVCDLADQWRYGGSFIGEVSHRREAYNLMLSMPQGTDPQTLKRAAQDFARAELAGHRWVMVLHEHQGNPHVHLSVRAEGMTGERLNPRKQDLQRWRDTFAKKLRDRGIEAESTRQFARGVDWNPSPLWWLKAQEEGRLRNLALGAKANETHEIGRRQALEAWNHLESALEQSMLPGDRGVGCKYSAVRDDRGVRQRCCGWAWTRTEWRLRGEVAAGVAADCTATTIHTRDRTLSLPRRNALGDRRRRR